MPFYNAKKVLNLWIAEGLKNVRFSGGEPTLYPHIEKLVEHCKGNNVERIAISTNGSANWDKYQALIDAGVNDFSVSLDACCSSMGDKYPCLVQKGLYHRGNCNNGGQSGFLHRDNPIR
jgi:molybdenum cofactor biosynthesis enzyme MoaA